MTDRLLVIVAAIAIGPARVLPIPLPYAVHHDRITACYHG
jgi:hypothetical protein